MAKMDDFISKQNKRNKMHNYIINAVKDDPRIKEAKREEKKNSAIVTKYKW